MASEASRYFPVETSSANEPAVVKAETSRVTAFLGLLIGTLLWNGFISVFVLLGLGVIGGGKFQWFVLLFMIPFVLIGIALFLGCIYSFLALFNPKAVLVCSESAIYPGQEIELSWMLQGKTHRIHKLSLFLEGTESASYRQGTSTRTELNKFFSKQIVETQDPQQIAQGFQLVQIPPDAMHTFSGVHNKISWTVRFKGEIRLWPDIADTFPMSILPPRTQNGAAPNA